MSNLNRPTLFIIFSILSCTEPILDNNSQQDSNQEVAEIVHFELNDSSILKMPYQGQTKVIFVDSLSNNLAFTIKEKELETHSEGNYNEDQEKCEPSSWTTQSKKIQLINDSLDLTFLLELKTELDHSGSNEKKFRDLLILWMESYPDKDKATSETEKVRVSRKALFQCVIDNRTSIYDSYWTTIDSLSIIGRTFYDVVNQNPNEEDSKFAIQFNFEYGIIAFNDYANKRWRFSHFSD